MFRKPKGKIFFAEMIECGLQRTVNQDAIYSMAKGDFGLFVLADGMGGHSRGELASQELMSACKEYCLKMDAKDKLPEFLDMVQDLTEVLRETNERIFIKYSQNEVCGSTLVLLLIKKDCYAVFSVGDSRVYTFYQGEMDLLTVDDIWDNLPLTKEKYSAEQIAADARRGKLVQAVGVKEEVSICVITNRIKRGQCFLLCSDGLYRFCSEQILLEGMKHVFSEILMHTVLEKYKKEVYQNGAKDNFSAILVCVR